MRCNVCKKEVYWEIVKEEFEHLFEQADSFGMASLTENQQVVLESKICSYECYEMME